MATWHVCMGPHRFTIPGTLEEAAQELERRLHRLALKRGPVIAWHAILEDGTVEAAPTMVDEIHHHAPGELEAHLLSLGKSGLPRGV